MRKEIPFDLLEPGQTLYFNIARLGQLETLLGHSINIIMSNQEVGVNFCVAGLTVGLQHHYQRVTKQFIAEKVEEYIDNGGSLDALAMPIVTAIIASGIMGKDESGADTKNAVKAQESELKV